MRKVLGVLLCISLVITMISGCAGNETNGGEDNTVSKNADINSPKNSDSSEKTQITIWDYFETDAQKEMMAHLLDQFNQSQSKYVAEHVYVPFANFKNQLTVGLQSGELPDLVIIDNPDMASYISMGLFADITNKIQDIDTSEYFPGPLASTMLDGKNYGLPFATNCTCLFYNKDIFDAAGVSYPTAGMTWNEFRETAQKVTDPSKGISGFGLSACNSEEGVFQCLPWLYSAGASCDDVNNEGGIATFRFFQEMVNEGSLAKEAINWTQSDVNNQFMSRTIAMQQNGPWQLPGIAANAPDLNYGVTIMPTNIESVSCLGGENLGVVNGDNIDGAIELLKFYDENDVMIQAMKEYGSFPTKTKAAQNEYWTNDETQKTFIQQLDTSVPRGPSPVWPQISTVLANAFQEAMTEAKSPEEVASSAQEELDAIEE